MTVCDLINELMLVKNKDAEVVVMVSDFYLEDIDKFSQTGRAFIIKTKRIGADNDEQ